MTWIRLGDLFADKIEAVGLNADAVAFHISAVCYCARHPKWDGHIPGHIAPHMFAVEDPEATIQALVDAGYWTQTEDGYQIVEQPMPRWQARWSK
jgi:hypothetical protein